MSYLLKIPNPTTKGWVMAKSSAKVGKLIQLLFEQDIMALAPITEGESRTWKSKKQT